MGRRVSSEFVHFHGDEDAELDHIHGSDCGYSMSSRDVVRVEHTGDSPYLAAFLPHQSIIRQGKVGHIVNQNIVGFDIRMDELLVVDCLQGQVDLLEQF